VKVYEMLFFAVISETAKQRQGKRHFHQKRIHYVDNTRRNYKKKNHKSGTFTAEVS